MGTNIGKVRAIANEVESVMRANPNMRQVNQDWGRACRRCTSYSIRIAFA